MINPFPLTRRAGLFAAMVAASTLVAQQPAPAGRGGAPALNPAQTAALTAAVVPPALSQTATAAATDLTGASLALPANAGDLTAKATALGAAELALALARADELAKVQALLKPITPAQATTALGRAGGGGRGGAPVVADTTDGYVSLFDGKTLTGWDGDPRHWSVRDGIIVASSLVNPIINGNTFLIWKGGNVKDFDLKVDYRFVGTGNSGVQVRSRMANPETRPWGISGLQLDMVTAGGTGSGVFYGEGGGTSALQNQGQAIHATPEGNRQIGTMGSGVADTFKPGPADATAPAGEWNTYHIIARQNVVAAFVNGRMVAFLVDDNRSAPTFQPEGLLALQMHTGQPFEVQFRNVYLRAITPELLTPLPAPASAAGRGGRGGP